MPLRRSPVLTPRSLAARRANALKSTGPRTVAGKARSCLNALRHGRRARDLRWRIERTGDSEALFMLDWFHRCILSYWQPRDKRKWRYTVRLAARVWCFMNGLSLRPRLSASKTPPVVGSEPLASSPEAGAASPESRPEAGGGGKSGTVLKRLPKMYQYAECRRCPRYLQISSKSGRGVRFLNPTPTRRRHVLLGWMPEFRFLPGRPPKAKRVRRPPQPGSGAAEDAAQPRRVLSERSEEPEGTKKEVQTNLESHEISAICNDLMGPLPGPAIECAGDGLQTGCEDSVTGAGAGLAGTHAQTLLAAHMEAESLAQSGAESPPYEGVSAERESIPVSDLEVSECGQELRALNELQWARWRQVMAGGLDLREPEKAPSPPPAERVTMNAHSS